MVAQETLKTLQATAVVFGLPPEMKGKSVFLKIQCISDVTQGPDVLELELIRKILLENWLSWSKRAQCKVSKEGSTQ